eukprot:TRINITY_DN63542_c0_g1_i1.p1 TRINITY_DN63542_c0_g1~~TRINITY_DN63542_c0_g1_i1.p1  ORF type:complete len:405 (+),score=45.41 TRINITY_DN63542_c0_g1_i1:48-1262(+)
MRVGIYRRIAKVSYILAVVGCAVQCSVLFDPFPSCWMHLWRRSLSFRRRRISSMAASAEDFVHVFLGLGDDKVSFTEHDLKKKYDQCVETKKLRPIRQRWEQNPDSDNLTEGHCLFIALQGLVLDAFLKKRRKEDPGEMIVPGRNMRFVRLLHTSAAGAEAGSCDPGASALIPELVDLLEVCETKIWTFRALLNETPCVRFCGRDVNSGLTVVSLKNTFGYDSEVGSGANLLRLLERLPQFTACADNCIGDFHCDWSCYGDDFLEQQHKWRYDLVRDDKTGEFSAIPNETTLIHIDLLEGKRCVVYERLVVSEDWTSRDCFFQPCIFIRISDEDEQSPVEPYRTREGEYLLLLPLAMVDVNMYGKIWKSFYPPTMNIAHEWRPADEDAEKYEKAGSGRMIAGFF